MDMCVNNYTQNQSIYCLGLGTHIHTCRQMHTYIHTYTHTQNTAKANYILLLRYLQLAFVQNKFTHI